MREVGSTLQIAATDLGRFLSCRHMTALDLQVAKKLRPKPPKRKDPFLDLLIQRGEEHEEEHKQKLRAEGREVVDLAGLEGPAAVDRTLEEMKRGAPAIAQAALGGDGWFGLADLLVKVETPSNLGPWSYEAYDTKLARETRGTAILQLCLYSDLLREIQGRAPESFYVVTPVQEEPYRFADYAAYYRLVRKNLREATQGDPLALEKASYPDKVDYCDVCRWWSQCEKRRRADDDLSFVAGITRLQRRELGAHGIATLQGLGEIALPLPFKPSRGSKDSFARVQRQARIQLEGRRLDKPIHELLEPVEAGRGLALLPEASEGDVFLDLEGDHFAREGGREYLFGMTVVLPGGRTAHRKIWAHDDAEEKRAFEAIMDEIAGLWSVHSGMHVYHFAPYEPSAFKRLMARHATRGNELDRMLRAGVFVDLYAVVRQGLRASVESYSIKELERFYGFARATDLKEAGSARRVVELALEIEDPGTITPEVRGLVDEYNREDCVSALELRKWLEALRKSHETAAGPIPRPVPGDGKASAKAEERSAEVQATMDALLAGVPEDPEGRTPGQKARWLLAHLLEFHRREDKVTWWEFYRLRDMTDEDELLDERRVIVGLKHEKRTSPTGKGKCPIDRYSFPSQDFEVGEGDELFTADGKSLGDVEGVDRAALWIEVKKRQNRIEDHPRWAFVHSYVRSDALVGSLMRLAKDVAARGFGAGRSAMHELLLRNAPRVVKGSFLAEPSESSTAFTRRVVLELDHSVLPIQGPPGAGKTHTGARMIVDCVRRGLRVGVSAVTHKVIRSLLEEVLEAAAEEKVPVACVQKVREVGPEFPGLEEVTGNDGVLGALEDGRAQVGAGTAWLWARPEYAAAVDVLFVDEAGQASLANVLAMSQAARNVVLLGDPQQLEQPQRGTHPEGVDASALEHLLAGRRTIPPDRGIFLEKTWRLPPEICSFTSELFYEGRLEPQPELARQKLSGAPPYEGAGLWFEPVEHDGNTNSSDEEVKAVEAIVSKLLAPGSRWTNDKGETKPMTSNDILVVAPFNAQVNRLLEALEPRRVKVGTVDRFQGQEAAVVIYSMATSRPEDAPRGMEFLYDLNRLNVATSRARCACMLVASPRLFDPDCKTPRQMRLANALCRYLERALLRIYTPMER